MAKEAITSIKWEAENLPAGLFIDKDTGVISGNYNPTVKVTTNYGTGSTPIEINATIPLVGLKGEKGDGGNVYTGFTVERLSEFNSAITDTYSSVWELLEHVINTTNNNDNVVYVLIETVDNIEGTIFENIAVNSLLKIYNGNFEIYSPIDNRLFVDVPVNSALSNYYRVYLYASSKGWVPIKYEDLQPFNEKVLYVFDAGTGDTLPSTCKRGEKFLLTGDGYTKVFTAIADDTWDSGYQLHAQVVGSTASQYKGNKYINLTKSGCFKFASANFASVSTATVKNPYKHSDVAETGVVVGEIGTGDTYTYNGAYLFKNNNEKVRHVTDIINQVYDTAPSKTNAPAEDVILMINNSYKRVYTNTNADTRWATMNIVDMPKNKSYLSLADKRIYSREGNGTYDILKFAPLLDGEIFYYESDGCYYIYRHATQSFEKVATTTTQLTASMQ